LDTLVIQAPEVEKIHDCAGGLKAAALIESACRILRNLFDKPSRHHAGSFGEHSGTLERARPLVSKNAQKTGLLPQKRTKTL
jgi:hypothetical protein